LSYIDGCPNAVMSTVPVLVACMIDLLLNGFRMIYALSVGWVSMGASPRAMVIAMRSMVGCVGFER